MRAPTWGQFVKTLGSARVKSATTSQLRIFYQPTSNFFGTDPTDSVYSNGELTSSAFSGYSFTSRATPAFPTGVWRRVVLSSGDAYFEVFCAPLGGPL